MIPNVSISVLDNQLGVRAPNNVVLAIVATAVDGGLAPVQYTRIKDVQSEYVSGHIVEAAAYTIERYGLPVLLTRADTATPGSYGTVVQAGGGTSVATADVATTPADDYDVVVEFTVGGTIGTTGMKYRFSTDGGADGGGTWSGIYPLGTATSITIPNTGGVKINFAAGTITTGHTVVLPCVAPAWDNTTYAAALESLRLTQAPWTFLSTIGDQSASSLSVLDAKLELMATNGRNRRSIAHTRHPTANESESTYLTSLTGVFGNSSSRRTMLCAGSARVDSSVGTRARLLRSPTIPVGPLAAAVSEEVDLAELAYGPLPGVAIRDTNGNPLLHDETINPGLDDARFLCFRSWEGRGGVWVNNPRLFSPTDSDFLYLQFGRIVDVACTIAREQLEPILSRGLLPKTDGSGMIDPETANSIDGQINGRLRSALVGTRKAAAVVFTISRTDDVLRTGVISWTVRVVPLSYPKSMPGTVALVASASASTTTIQL